MALVITGAFLMSKISKVDKIVIFSSIACGVIASIPTYVYHWSFAWVLGVMLISTLIAQWYVKITLNYYRIKVSFQSGVRGPQIIFTLIGGENTLVWLSVTNLNNPLYLDRIEELLASQNITFIDGYLSFDNQIVYANKFIKGYQLLIEYKSIISNLLNIYQANTSNKKRRSLIFWK